MRRRSSSIALLVAALLAAQACAGALAARSPSAAEGGGDDGRRHRIAEEEPAAAAVAADANRHHKHRHRHKHPYSSPAGLFIQERASKQLPGPGQHFSFGAVKPWEDIQALLDEAPSSDRKLLLVVRHGQAISNYLSDTLGPDEWFAVEGTCRYDDKEGTVWNIFDADLTGLGQDQARSLGSMLSQAGWFQKMSGGRAARAVISPLTRCLRTASIVLDKLRLNATAVEEDVRETLGEDTCDARRSASDPNDDQQQQQPGGGGGGEDGDGGRPPRPPSPEGPCSFDRGLRSSWPQYRFVVHDPDEGAGRGFGLLGDSDHLWTKGARERQKDQVKRAKRFLDVLFDRAPEPVVVVVTHSGFTRSLLLAVQREPYRPVNAELVPVIVDKARTHEEDDEGEEGEEGEVEGAAAPSDGGVASGKRAGCRHAKSKQQAAAMEQQQQRRQAGMMDGEDEDDAWVDEVLQRHAALLAQQAAEDDAARRPRRAAGGAGAGDAPCVLRRLAKRVLDALAPLVWGRGL